MVSGASTVRAGNGKRLDGIDLLRGLAIFFVLMNHVNMQLLFADVPYTRGLPKQLVSSLVWNGQQGVQIFFTVSGFLITSTSLRRWKSLDRVSIVDFYRLRFARIAPLLLGLLSVLSALDLMGVPHFVLKPETGGLGRALVAALTFHVNLLEARRGYLSGAWDILWSLSVEETTECPTHRTGIRAAPPADLRGRSRLPAARAPVRQSPASTRSAAHP